MLVKSPPTDDFYSISFAIDAEEKIKKLDELPTGKKREAGFGAWSDLENVLRICFNTRSDITKLYRLKTGLASKPYWVMQFTDCIDEDEDIESDTETGEAAIDTEQKENRIWGVKHENWLMIYEPGKHNLKYFKIGASETRRTKILIRPNSDEERVLNKFFLGCFGNE
ncbi:MAG: hypothetical protein JNK26_05465 [Candidatus Doudnabacteria bacterium]|nr:hypothetical protein [Candidatus Doudnabacteria bacterium]